MFFFIGGIQPKTVLVDEQPRVCPSCGLGQARLKRVDHYLSLFFIPLFRVKKGEPFLECPQCGVSGGLYGTGSGPSRELPPRCPYCGYPVEPTFRYCPSCGRSL
ncbi:MAG: zinc ribbon domain-containing protein [Deltaproteobacteria bacterium]|nr:zinc ribbon domain-containing protein [Deltaproteobacteria bacterium]